MDTGRDTARIDLALSRIEAALARIEQAAGRPSENASDGWSLYRQQRDRVRNTLGEIDRLIADIEQ